MKFDSKFQLLTVEEYLRQEETGSIKHEYVDGRVFAMSGANKRHNIIAGNIFVTLHGFLEGTPCRPFIEAMKTRIRAANCFYYPDVMVACNNDDDESDYTETPVLIVEVLSPSTAALDRREKLANYTKIPTLVEYLIVHQRLRKIELYRKETNGTWHMSKFCSSEELVLESLPKGRLSILVDSIYRNVSSKQGKFEVHEEPEEYYLSEEEACALDW